jgi:plasmid stabilization system protein ParE
LPYRIQILEPAEFDIFEYAQYIKFDRQDALASDRWVDGLDEAIAALAENPEQFNQIPEATKLGFPYRSFNYHSHRVIYAIHSEENLVLVHRVYHMARRPLTKRRLGPQ